MLNLPDPDRQPQFYEGVALKRLIAWVIDGVITVTLCLIAVVMTVFIGAFFWPLLFLVLGFAYRVVTISNGSATLGMRFVGIELRNADGEMLDPTEALAHTFGYTVSVAIPILQVVSVVMMLTNSRGQGLTDTVLGTVAMNRRVRLRA